MKHLKGLVELVKYSNKLSKAEFKEKIFNAYFNGILIGIGISVTVMYIL